MENSDLGKALLVEIENMQPDAAQKMSNYFYYGICNALYCLMTDYGANEEQEELFITEIIMASREFMKAYIEIYKKYNDLY